MIQRRNSDYGHRARNSLYYDLNGKAAHLDLKDCEDERMIDEYYKVFDNIYRFADVDYIIFCTIFSKFFSFTIMSCILISVDWKLFFMIDGIYILSVMIQSKQDEREHKYEEKMAVNAKRLKYLKELLYDFDAGRELRIFDSGAGSEKNLS